jgi:hypothetical protein
MNGKEEKLLLRDSRSADFFVGSPEFSEEPKMGRSRSGSLMEILEKKGKVDLEEIE